MSFVVGFVKRVGIALIACWLGLPIFAQSPRIQLESAKNDVFSLSLANVTGSTAELEGSVNLEDWFTLASANADNSVAHFTFTNDISDRSWFFRGVVGAATGPALAIAQVDTNLTAGALITPETGGSMSLEDDTGVIYEFTVSSNLVSEPVAVQMTVITNFSQFPDHDGARAALRFSPDGFAFRSAAQLRIIFPTNVPPAEMLAYSFENDGSGFHLVPARPGSNEVVLAVTHFSGAGVARFSSGKVPSFDRAWNGAKSGIRAAEHRAALRYHEAVKELYVRETITEAEFDARETQIGLLKLEDIYRSAVKPFERAGVNDCAIGQAVVLAELDRLANEWARLTGKNRRLSPYFPKIAAFAPYVRCACAHRLIDRCENEPNVSGSDLYHALEFLLLDTQIATGRTDAQGCDLGSDDEIRDRLTSGACFGAWEGTIRLTRITSRKGSVSTDLGNLPRTETDDDEIRQIFDGEIKEVAEQRIFVNNGGQLEEFWKLNLGGPVHIGYRIDERVELDLGDVVMIETEKVSLSDSPLGIGDTTLLLRDGKFVSLGPGAGTTKDYRLLVASKQETTYRCKTPRPPNNPCPEASSNTSKSSFSSFQGYGIDAGDPKLNVTINSKGLSLTWTRHKETPEFGRAPQVVDEEIVVTFRRGPKR